MVREFLIELVEEHKETMSISSILEIFEVPRSTYYRWKKDYNRSKAISKNEALVIKKCKETNKSYGYRIITGILNKQGRKISKNTVQRIMQRYNLQCLVKPRRQIHFSKKLP